MVEVSSRRGVKKTKTNDEVQIDLLDSELFGEGEVSDVGEEKADTAVPSLRAVLTSSRDSCSDSMMPLPSFPDHLSE